MNARRLPSADRILVGAFAALVVARPLVDAGDPGRLRLTTSAGPLSFNLLVFVLLGIVAVRRALFGGPRLGRSALVPLLLLGVAGVTLVGVYRPDHYVRPGVFVAWEWAALAAAFVLARLLTRSAEDGRGILNVFVASAVSIAGLGLYQGLAEVAGLPPTDPPAATGPPLVGDDEFHPAAARLPFVGGQPHGTFDGPDTFIIYICLAWIVGLLAVVRFRIGPGNRWHLLALHVILYVGMVCGLIGHFSYTRQRPPLDVRTAIAEIQNYPVLGTGAENWCLVGGDARESPGAWLALAVTTGVLGLGLFAATLVVPAWTSWNSRPTEAFDERADGPRWEFHLGGIAGLVLGFIWAAGALPPEAPADEVFRLAATALLRAAFWIGAFSIMESCRSPLRAREVVRGLALVILFGCATAGAGRFTVLFPMFVLLGLAMNAPIRAADEIRVRPAAVGSIGLGLAAWALAVGQLATAAVPGWATAAGVREARLASRLYPDKVRQIEQSATGGPQTTARTGARNFLVKNILGPLEAAALRDPRNAALWLEVARWRRTLWELELYLDGKTAARMADRALEAADRAAELDPGDPAARWNKFESLLVFRRLSVRRPDERLDDLNHLIADIAARDPTAEVPLRYRVVDVLLARRNKAASSELAALLRLNRVEGAPHGRLTDEQEADLVEREKRMIPLPPQEVPDEAKKK